MNNYLKLERKVIESMIAKGRQKPYQTRRKSLQVLSLLTGLASATTILTYILFKFEMVQGRVENIEVWSFPFFIMLLLVTFTSQKRIQAINQLEKERNQE